MGQIVPIEPRRKGSREHIVCIACEIDCRDGKTDKTGRADESSDIDGVGCFGGHDVDIDKAEEDRIKRDEFLIDKIKHQKNVCYKYALPAGRIVTVLWRPIGLHIHKDKLCQAVSPIHFGLQRRFSYQLISVIALLNQEIKTVAWSAESCGTEIHPSSPHPILPLERPLSTHSCCYEETQIYRFCGVVKGASIVFLRRICLVVSTVTF